ncbi:G_PROTEIN_RECEP_F1_2 domain-containing protein [Meloidogyne graminicola]|uniref:G_PROTEIN_RECEP_F1_2 domain-containing protein n=1 Tax=Meloidogyne graminicola TaxID=189291 RepID=A0A8S9ZH59_9BILA|nr:G_PROTEIN_RECEP_F1_2 domain-containing protein [Meloidogyne graminicola]
MEATNNTTNILNYPNHMFNVLLIFNIRINLYSEYKNSGPSFALIIPAVLMNIAGIPGIAANLLLISVTIQNNKLRGPTNYLLALTAFFEILHQTGHLFFLVITASGINFINYSTALNFQIYSIFGVTAAQTTMCSTAADRLFSVLFPIKYKLLKKHPYLFFHTLLAIISGIWMSINAINLSIKYPTLPVTGYISDLLVLDMEIMFHYTMFLCALNVLIYIIVWIVVRFLATKNNNDVQSQIESRLLKSLILIVSIVIGGYVINNICRIIIDHFLNLNDIQIWSVNVFGGILLNIGASAETPTLYIFSSIYREAINKQLKKFFCKKKNNTSIAANPVGGKINLRGPTNYLLALTAFFEILHQSGHFAFLFVSISGINLINYSTALKFQIHSIFGLTAAQTTMCSTAADRLFSVLFPIKYKLLKIRPYLFFHTLLAIISGIWMSINAINLSIKYPTLPVTGRVGDLLTLDMEIMLQFIMILCGVNVALYVFVWIVVRCFYPTKHENGSEFDQQSRLLKSLVLIISIVIGGFLLNSICRLIINRFFNLMIFNVLGGLFLNIGASAETPTLYMFSTLYREVINKQIKKSFCKTTHKNTISVIPGLINSNGGKEGISGKTKHYIIKNNFTKIKLKLL